jgi:hypothetical protein
MEGKMTREEAKIVLAPGELLLQNCNAELIIDIIYDAHKAELKKRDDRIAELEAELANSILEGWKRK